MNAPEPLLPLVVDVDGSLVRGDLLHEATLKFIAHHPFESWRLLLWLVRGKKELREQLAARMDLSDLQVPLQTQALHSIKAARENGRKIVLTSASPRQWVEPLAARIGGAEIVANEASLIVAGSASRAALVESLGEAEFDYLDSLAPERASPSDYLRALRPHQWTKNLLLFLPLVASHTMFDPRAALAALIAFLAFCAAASSAYIINDLLDLTSDRDHPDKKNRPFASGAISPVRGLALAAILVVSALCISMALPMQFTMILATYLSLTLAYSLVLKRRLIIDIIALGGLYTIRVIAGVIALEQTQSTWLFMFSLFLFLSLAAIKRCSELVARRESGKPDPLGRGYRIGDAAALFPLAAAAGYGAVLVVALYISSPDVMVLYRYPERLWLTCPLLLYWISRIIVISSRNELHHDPLIFAITDKVSWFVGALTALVIATSI